MRALNVLAIPLALGLAMASGARADEPQAQAAAAPTPVFSVGEHASTYDADKKVGGGKIAHVTGKNSDIAVKVEVDGSKRRVLVTVPVDKFVSGSSRRDKDVANFLGGSQKLPVIISSAWLEAIDFSRLAHGPEGACAGQVELQGVKKDLALTVKGDGKAIWVQAVTAFSQLGLEPPKVGPFGWFGAVLDPLTLTAQIQIAKSEVPEGAIGTPEKAKKKKK